MKVLIVVACVLAAAAATPGLIGAPVAYSAPVAAAVVVAPSVSSQYHAQDELGQFSYGYQGPLSAKQEVRTADGITRGGYSYVDAHGLVQSAQYVSDPVNGFRVAATNLPVGPGVPAPPVPAPVAVAAAPVAAVAAAPAVVEARYAAPAVVGAPLPVADTPEVAAAKAAHFQAHAAAKAAIYGRKKRSPGLLAAPAVAAYAAPASVAVHAPVAYAAPASVAVHAPVAYAAHAVVPARSFAYSTVAAHPGAIVAAHPGAVVVA
ncbi:hypothetical protein R5R35_008128 [Gryllus longicercus]|uniref:Cuticle protein n=1 Tax=Gryllus longicercus TaxID=2509291 RepID=A0AAN9VI33_9ORTH